MKITDIHCHIFPDKIARKASKAIGDFYGIPMAYDGTREKLKELARERGVTRMLIHSVASNASQVEHINDYIAESVRLYPDLFSGFATMHPDYPDISGEIDRAVGLGLLGVKIHPDMQKFAIDDPAAYPIYEAIEGRLPILVHTGDYRYNYSHPYMMAKVMRDFPRLAVIGAHFGGYSEIDEVEEAYKGLPVMIDTSSSLFYMSPERAAGLIRKFGVENTMFGTDYPMWDYGEELERFMKIPLTDREREDILYNNAKERLGIG